LGSEKLERRADPISEIQHAKLLRTKNESSPRFICFQHLKMTKTFTPWYVVKKEESFLFALN